MEKKKIRDTSRLFGYVVKLGFASCPLAMSVNLLSTLAQGPLAAYTTRCIANIVDGLIDAAGGGTGYAMPIIMAALAAVVSLALYLTMGYSVGISTMRIKKTLTKRMLEVSTSLSYFDFISAEQLDDAGAAKEAAERSIGMILTCSANVIVSASGIVSYAALLTGYGSPIVAVLCVLLLLASIFVTKRFLIIQTNTLEQTFKNRRRSDYLESLYFSGSAAAEMAYSGSKSYIDSLHSKEYKAVIAENVRLEAVHRRSQSLVALIQCVLLVAATFIVVTTGSISTAGSVTAVLMSMRAIMSQARDVGKNAGLMAGYFEGLGLLLKYEKKYSPRIQKPDEASAAAEGASAAELKNVSFSYGDNQILSDISLRIERGEHIAIVGENGAGKTTLINLLLGLFPAKEGSVRLFGADPFALLQADMPTHAFALFQNFGKYAGLSIGENIGFDEKADTETLGRIDPFLTELDMEQLVGEDVGGRNFSGGEWQKLALARCATAKDAELIVLDEPTAALDPMAEMEIFNNTMELFADKAVVLITHRLGAVRRAKRIYVIKDGIVFEEGSHAELMAKRGFYFEMFNAQAGWYGMEVE